MPRSPQEIRELAAVLEAVAPSLRKAGVLKFCGVELAPMGPQPERIELTPDELYERQVRAANLRRDIQFAASSIKPILRHPPRNPDHVVQRAASARERGSGVKEEA